MNRSIGGIIFNQIISYKWDHAVRAFKIKMLKFSFWNSSEEKEMGESKGTAELMVISFLHKTVI